MIQMLVSFGTSLEAMRLFLVMYQMQTMGNRWLPHPRNFFGDYPQLNSDSICNLELVCKTIFVHFPVCRINKRNLAPMEAHFLEREMLKSDRSYILDCGAEIFLWIGMTTLVSERKTSATALEVRIRIPDYFPFFYNCISASYFVG